MERKKIAQMELKNAQQENAFFQQTQKMEKIEKELDDNRTIRQQLTNLPEMKGSDGNCKRCEALIFMNGSYIEKIKKLKMKLGANKE